MADERIDIIIRDRINTSIHKKIHNIGQAARAAEVHVQALRRALNFQNAHSGIRDSGVDRLRRDLDRANAAANRGATSNTRYGNSVTRMNASMRGFRRSSVSFVRDLRSIAAITAIFAAGRGLVGSIDAYTNLQNKLKNVTKDQRDLNETTEKLFDIANKARVPVGELGKSFQRFDLSLRAIGRTQEESIRLTETVSKLLTLQGATATESASALLQLSQAFNKGKLDGDEFRTVMELMPRAAQAIADELGITRGELLKTARTGVVTSEVMANAFARIATDVDKAFDKTTLTLGQALTVVSNRFIQFFGKIDKRIGLTQALSKAFVALGENIEPIAASVTILSGALLAAFSPQIIASMGRVIGLLKTVALFALANPYIAALAAIGAVITALVVYQDKIKVSQDGLVTMADWLQAFGERARVWFEELTKLWNQLWNSDIVQNAINGAVDAGQFLWKSFVDGMKVIGDGLRVVLNLLIGFGEGLGTAWNTFLDATKDQTWVQRIGTALVLVKDLFVVMAREIVVILEKALTFIGNKIIDVVNSIDNPFKFGTQSLFNLDKLTSGPDEIREFFDISLSDTGKRVGESFLNGFSESLEADRVGTFFGAVRDVIVGEFQTINNRAREIANERVENERQAAEVIKQEAVQKSREKFQLLLQDAQQFGQLTRQEEEKLRATARESAIARVNINRIADEDKRRSAFRANEAIATHTQAMATAIKRIIEDMANVVNRILADIGNRIQRIAASVGALGANAPSSLSNLASAGGALPIPGAGALSLVAAGSGAVGTAQSVVDMFGGEGTFQKGVADMVEGAFASPAVRSGMQNGLQEATEGLEIRNLIKEGDAEQLFQGEQFGQIGNEISQIAEQFGAVKSDVLDTFNNEQLMGSLNSMVDQVDTLKGSATEFKSDITNAGLGLEQSLRGSGASLPGLTSGLDALVDKTEKIGGT